MESKHNKINKPTNVIARNKIIRNELNENQTQVQNEKGIIVKKIMKQRNDDNDNNNDKIKKKYRKSLTPIKGKLSNLGSSYFTDTSKTLEINNSNDKRNISLYSKENAFNINDNILIDENDISEKQDNKKNNEPDRDLKINNSFKKSPINLKKKYYKTIGFNYEDSNLGEEIKINFNTERIKRTKSNDISYNTEKKYDRKNLKILRKLINIKIFKLKFFSMLSLFFSISDIFY